MEPTDQEIIDYLLGDSNETEQLRMEESLFSGDDLFDRLTLVENRLIDLYILNQLTDSEREAFEKKYLITERRRKAVVGSKRYLELVTSYRQRKPLPSVDRWGWLKSLFSSPKPVLTYALASLLILVSIGFLWLFFNRVQLNKRNAETEAALRAKEEELRQARMNNEGAGQERAALEQERQELLRNEELLRKREEELRALEARVANNSSGRPSIIAFVLSSTVRSGPEGSELIIKGQQMVHLIAYLKDNRAENYRASLQRVNGEEVWNATLPKPRSELKRLTMQVPASVFSDTDYFVKIEAVAADGKRTTVAEYSLAVRRQ